MTLDQDKWFRYLELTKNSNTAKQYDRMFRLHAYEFETQEGLEMFLISKKSKVDQKINSLYLGFVKCIIDCFKLDLVIPKDTKKNRSLQRIPKFLSKEEIDLIIDKSSYRTGILVQLFFETGLRLRELFNAKRDDINLKKRTISGIGKGNKDFEEKFSKDMSIRLGEFFEENGNRTKKLKEEISKVRERIAELS